MKPSTHRGSCQCCGAAQKLPEGVLAKHGYTTRWGFFSGVCSGSGYKPYELSCDLIERFVANAGVKLGGLQAMIEKLGERPAEGTTKAWRNVYRSGNHRMKAGYVWMEVDLTFTIESSSSDPDFQWMRVEYAHPDKRFPDRIDFYDAMGRSLDPLAYVLHLNGKYAAALAKEAEQVADYIAWQRRRIAEWKLQELLPL